MLLKYLHFCSIFWLCRKTPWQSAKIILKIMTSQSEQQVITEHILLNISRTKGNQTMTMEFGQLIKHNIRNIFLEKPYKVRCWRLAFTLYKASFKRRVLKLAFLLDFLHDFLRKIFLTLYFISWPNFIAWLYFLLQYVYCNYLLFSLWCREFWN